MGLAPMDAALVTHAFLFVFAFFLFVPFNELQ